MINSDEKPAERPRHVRLRKEVFYRFRGLWVLASLSIAASIFFWPGVALPEERDTEPNGVAANSCHFEQEKPPDLESCFGVALDNCIKSFPGEAVIPLSCWKEELAIWNKLMEQTLSALLQDMKKRGYGSFIGQIETAQTHWHIQSRLDCNIQMAATPNVHGTIGVACMAQETHNRLLFLRQLLGADWTD